MAVILARPANFSVVQQLVKNRQMKDRFEVFNLGFDKIIFDVEEFLSALIIENGSENFIKEFLAVERPNEEKVWKIINTDEWFKILDSLFNYPDEKLIFEPADKFITNTVTEKIEKCLKENYINSFEWGYGYVDKIESISEDDDVWIPRIAFTHTQIEENCIRKIFSDIRRFRKKEILTIGDVIRYIEMGYAKNAECECENDTVYIEYGEVAFRFYISCKDDIYIGRYPIELDDIDINCECNKVLFDVPY